YERRFGSWRKALEAFVVRMNQDNSSQNQDIQKEKLVISKPEKIELLMPIVVQDKGGIGLGLRYKVLSRDKFKCVKCGISPATDHSCRLHIDHRIPFSKGGRTALENLQTLCEHCNLGKGNRHLE
ncbi:MAG TPA: HNH endonuclease, partial [Candidatus Omnitrophota bacterium]|nr:HNH endonuclease [Candidatus Omnitrophota bacterium]